MLPLKADCLINKASSEHWRKSCSGIRSQVSFRTPSSWLTEAYKLAHIKKVSYAFCIQSAWSERIHQRSSVHLSILSTYFLQNCWTDFNTILKWESILYSFHTEIISCSYRPNMNPTLHKPQVEIIDFLENGLSYKTL